jgi:uncharacterized damage-inducible protein DinB
MRDHFRDMFAFERWANHQILTWLLQHPHHAEMRKIFAHIIAENLPWLYLLRGHHVPGSINPEPNWSLNECQRQLPTVMDALESFVQSSSNDTLKSIVRSPGANGVVFENTATEVLTGLLNHAEHHRGQLLWLIAKETGEYVPSLYLSYLRKVPAEERVLLA